MGEDAHVLQLPNAASWDTWGRVWAGLGKNLLKQHRSGADMAYRIATLSNPRRFIDYLQGIEDYNAPSTHHLVDLPPERPDVVHLHNLHGGYFDLRALAELSQQVPVVVTLHDAWLLSGHCAHSFDCERWRSGCGSCPDLHIYPAVRRDATAYNWRRKGNIYARSALYVATPCHWLMDKVQQSMLQPAIVRARVIPNGVDTKVFHPDDKQLARAELGLPPDARICLFVGHGIRNNMWKDYAMIEAAIRELGDSDVYCLCLGETGDTQHVGAATIRFIEPQHDPRQIARYYQAADVYLHAARADTFPTVVLEALACGTPVIATAVGGIPEQIEDGQTGFLVISGDSVMMAARLRSLLADDEVRCRMGVAAACVARERFNMQRMIDEYIHWYHEIVQLRGVD